MRNFLGLSTGISKVSSGFQFHTKRIWIPTLTSRIEPKQPPIIIGAMGGSGTRLLVQILRAAGVWMGKLVDPISEDSLPMRYFLKRRFNEIVQFIDKERPPTAVINKWFDNAVQQHLWGIPDQNTAWGWKNPRNMWLLPFFTRFYPNLRIIHMIRDGRDMATSNNTFLLKKHGEILLGKNYSRSRTLSQLRLWTMGNLRAWEFGNKILGKNYMLVKYEDLYLSPNQIIRKIFKFFALDTSEILVSKCASMVSSSVSIGRWKKTHDQHLISLESSTKRAMETFGYEI